MVNWLRSLGGLIQAPSEVAALQALIDNPSAADREEMQIIVDKAWRSDNWDLHTKLAQMLLRRWQGDLSSVPLAALAAACLAQHRAGLRREEPWHSYHELGRAVSLSFESESLSLDQCRDPRAVSRLQLALALRIGPWASSLPAFLDAEGPASRAGWVHLFSGSLRFWCNDARPAENVKPKRLAAFRKDAELSLREIGIPHFCATLRSWLASVDVDEEALLVRGEDVLCGSIIAASTLSDGGTAAAIAHFLERCYRSIGHDGLGTAAMLALACMPNGAGMPSLVNARIGRRAGQLRREKLLAKLAGEQNTSVAELSDVGSPDLGLDENCELTRDFGDYFAVVRPEGSRSAVVRWHAAGGKALKSVPPAIKQDHAAEVKQLAESAKALSSALLGRIDAMERSYLSPRTLSRDAFFARLRDQPIERHLATKLIWRAESPGGVRTMLCHDGQPQDSDGRAVELPQDARLGLWHPLHGSTDEAAAWRNRIMALGVVQPFKQAHRETYVVTDAEEATATYSNRFAAHILRQRQFAQLMSQRGWRYRLQGDFDSYNEAELPLAEHGITASFNVDKPDFEQERHAFFDYIATDRVHFLRPPHWLPLNEVPPVVFSECMRHVDLAVAVASIGNDPAWRDGGPNRVGLPYWQSYGRGPLERVGEARRELLLALLPRLAAADRLSVDDRWLNVRGTLRAYRIHIRSLQVEVLPSRQHLCIIEKGPAATLVLPFEGDDALALLISKALLLLNDDKIKDPGIKDQLDRTSRA